MAAATTFNNIILGQFVLTGVPVKVYTSNRFLILTDVDDVEDPSIGFGMDENGEMIQFEYPEVQFIHVNGNKVDIATYNKGMAALYGGEDVESKKDSEDKKSDDKAKEDPSKGASMSDHYNPRGKHMKLKDLLKESFLGELPSERNMIKMKYNPLKEISQEEVYAEMEAAESEIDAAKAKAKAADAAEKDTIKNAKDKIKAAKANLKVATENVSVVSESHITHFAKGDVIGNTDPSCMHYGSKGIVIDLSVVGEVKYSVTNGGPQTSYKPGDVLTKKEGQLEKI